MMLKSLFYSTDNKLHSRSDCIIDKSELAVPVLHRLLTENVFSEFEHQFRIFTGRALPFISDATAFQELQIDQPKLKNVAYPKSI